MENFNAILVLMERIYFLVRVAQERGLTNSNNGGKCRARYFCIATLVKKCKSICLHQRFIKITYILKPRQIGSKLYTLICEQGTDCVIKRGSFFPIFFFKTVKFDLKNKIQTYDVLNTQTLIFKKNHCTNLFPLSCNKKNKGHVHVYI